MLPFLRMKAGNRVRDPSGRSVDSPDSVPLGLGSILGSEFTGRWARFPLVVAVVVAHGLVLAWQGAVARPLVVVALLAGLVASHVVLIALSDPHAGWIPRDAVSLAVAAAATAADGGTESPLFFWSLLFLAAQALRHPARTFGWLCGLALGLYAAVVVFADDVTAASAGRAFLFVAYCAVLLLGLRRLERTRSDVVAAGRFVLDALDAAPVGVAILDGGSVVYSNNHGRRVAEVLREDHQELIAGGPPSGSTMVTLDGGAGKVAHLRLLHAPIEAGDRPLLLVFAEDVTVRVAQDEARTRFLEEVAHQFRTPLTPIAAYAELLFDGGLSPDERIEASESIRHHAAELRSLLEQLTGLLRLRSSLSLDLGPVTMGAVIDEIGSALPGSGGAIAARGEAEVTVLTHLEAASRGLAELVSNSITHGIPPVQVAWERGDGFVEVVVRDGGPGPSIMDGATFSKVWDVPRAGNVVSPSMGHQLGLARAAAYLEQAGATLVFHRGDGPWAFTVRFPI